MQPKFYSSQGGLILLILSATLIQPSAQCTLTWRDILSTTVLPLVHDPSKPIAKPSCFAPTTGMPAWPPQAHHPNSGACSILRTIVTVKLWFMQIPSLCCLWYNRWKPELTNGKSIDKYLNHVSGWCQHGNTSLLTITEIKHFELSQFSVG